MSKAVIPPSIGTGGSIFGGGGGVNCAKSGTESSVNSMINLIVRFIGIVVIKDVEVKASSCSCDRSAQGRNVGLHRRMSAVACERAAVVGVASRARPVSVRKKTRT